MQRQVFIPFEISEEEVRVLADQVGRAAFSGVFVGGSSGGVPLPRELHAQAEARDAARHALRRLVAAAKAAASREELLAGVRGVWSGMQGSSQSAVREALHGSGVGKLVGEALRAGAGEVAAGEPPAADEYSMGGF